MLFYSFSDACHSFICRAIKESDDWKQVDEELDVLENKLKPEVTRALSGMMNLKTVISEVLEVLDSAIKEAMETEAAISERAQEIKLFQGNNM